MNSSVVSLSPDAFPTQGGLYANRRLDSPPMDEKAKVAVFERVADAWNRGDFEAMLDLIVADFEWDCRPSHIPGLSELYRGHDGYLDFVRSWRETLGPTQIEVLEARELDDGRFYTLIRQTATGPRSGVEVELEYVQLSEFEGTKVSRSAVYGDRQEGRAAAGLD
jgi:ketosteroid isomerase-like protein